MNMRITYLSCILSLTALTGTVGCAKQELSGAAEPGVQLSRLKSFHVVQGDSDDVTKALAGDLTARGFTVTTGTESTTPATAQCKVLSTNKWMWDITMYPLEIKVEMVDPKSGALLASGRSYRTSMVRKSPEGMAHEIFDKIFGPAPAQPTATASARADRQ
jgi:hypothetical protein